MSQGILRVAAGDDPEFGALLTGSHLRIVGIPLADTRLSPAEAAHWLYHEAPFGLLAHELSTDPVFRYANLTAQRVFGYDWAEFDGLPSRLSAASPDRAERAHLLDDVMRDGFSNDYRGLRISKSGAQFWIEDATVWNLVNEDNELRGQAAAFRSVTLA